MFSAKLEIIFCMIGSTFSNLGVLSCIDDLLPEDFSRYLYLAKFFQQIYHMFFPRNIFCLYSTKIKPHEIFIKAYSAYTMEGVCCKFSPNRAPIDT